MTDWWSAAPVVKPAAKGGGDQWWNDAPVVKEAPGEKPPSGFGANVMDFFKSVPRGIVSGLAGAMSSMGEAEAQNMPKVDEKGRTIGIGMEGVPSKEESTRIVEGTLTGKLHEPQTFGGRLGAAAGEAAGTPSTYIGGAGMVRNIAGGIASGIGGQIGSEVAGTPGAIIGGMVGNAAGARAVGKTPKAPLPKPATPTPTTQELNGIADAAYDDLRASRETLSPKEVTNLGATIKKELKDADFYKEDNARVYTQLNRLKKYRPARIDPMSGEMLAEKESKVTSGEVYKVRQALAKVTKYYPGTESAEAARRSIEKIDEFLDSVPNLSETSQIARAAYRAAKTSEALNASMETGRLRAAGSGTGQNVQNAMRQQARQFAKNKFLTPEERELAKRIAEGDTQANLARHIKKLGTDDPLGKLATGGLQALDFMGGHGGGHIMAAIVGILAKRAAERGTAKQVEELDEMIRRSVLPEGEREVPKRDSLRFTVKATGVPVRGGLIGAEAQQKKPKNRLYDE